MCVYMYIYIYIYIYITRTVKLGRQVGDTGGGLAQRLILEEHARGGWGRQLYLGL